MNTPAIDVRDNPAEQRFEARLDAALAQLQYRLEGPVLVLHHTEVPPALEGRGIAGRLVATAMDQARARGLRVRPLCTYVQAWLQRHPECADLVDAA